MATAGAGPNGAQGSCSLLTPLEEAVWFGLLHAHAALTKALDAEMVRAHRLPLICFEVLVHAFRAEGGAIGMSDLAHCVLLSPSGISRLVDRLAQDGLLCRLGSDADGRCVRVALTALGRVRLAEAARTHADVIRQRFLSALGEDDKRRLAEVWRRVAAGAG
jgi:DNA-binding MarR family transcriptional regulator